MQARYDEAESLYVAEPMMRRALAINEHVYGVSRIQRPPLA